MNINVLNKRTSGYCLLTVSTLSETFFASRQPHTQDFYNSQLHAHCQVSRKATGSGNIAAGIKLFTSLNGETIYKAVVPVRTL
jgi:hypothetical protein